MLAGTLVALVSSAVAVHRINHVQSSKPGNSSGAFYLLPTLTDEPPEQDLIGPSGQSPDGPRTAATLARPDAEPTKPWYGLCPKGRVKSIRDFQDAVLGDPGLLAYYGQFNWERAHLVSLESPVEAYVNYRKDGRIARTTRQVALPEGDKIITDGKIKVRTHCCNELVEAIEVPEAAPEPAPEMESAAAPAEPVTVQSMDSEPMSQVYVEVPLVSLGVVNTGGLPYFYRDRMTPYPLPRHSPPPAPVPEPAVWELVATGLGASGLFRWIRRSKKG